VLGLSREEARKTFDSYQISDAVSTWTGAAGLYAKRGSFGKGRAVYIPRVTPAYQGTTVRMDLPVNWPELEEAVRWAAGGEFSVRVQAPQTVVMNLYEKKEKDQMILHLVNFKPDLLRGIPVELNIPAGKKVRSVTLISTDREGTQSVPFTLEKAALNFRVPELKLYDMLVIQLG
jgi:hypothetical protein